MVYYFRPHPRNRASSYVDAIAHDNPSLPPGSWVRAYTSYDRREEKLGQASNRPSVLRTEGIKAPSDFFGPGGTGLVVSARFKDLIQSFEPHGHDFQEIALEDEKGRKWPGRFFLWRVRTFVQAIDMDRSSVARHRKFDGSGELLSLEAPQKLEILPEAVRSMHIWKNEPGFGDYVFCSDEFRSRCREMEIKYLLFHKCG